MKNSLVIIFAVTVAVTSAARLPEANSRLSLDILEPVLEKIIDHFHKVKSEDVYENEADAVPEVSQPKEVDDSLEEFRQKPMNLKALLEKIESLEKQQQMEADLADKEDTEDSDVFYSNGLDKPVKFDDVKPDNEKESDEENEEETEDSIVPISFGLVEEAIDMTKEDNPDVQISYGLSEPIEALAVKKDVAEEEEDEDDNEEKANEFVMPIREVKAEEEFDDDEVQISFGLAEPIEAAAVKKINLQEDADDEDDDEDKPSDLNEKVMSHIISSVIQKFAKVHGLKL